MTRRQMSTGGRLSRRSALGLLGAVPLAAAGTAALAGNADARASSASPASTPSGSPPSALRPGGAFEKYVSGLAAQDQFSGTVLLAWRGEPVLVRGYQQANKEKNIPNQADTIFVLASLTKFFTGLAVTQLAAQGKIDFSVTVGAYLDGLPSAIADYVTVHELLTHTSGVPEIMNDPAYQQLLRTWTTNTEAFNGTLQFIQGLTNPTVSTPGTKYNYTNTDYFLAGAVVASASGQNLWDYVPQHIFRPARMTSTGFYTSDQLVNDPRIAHNYGPPVTTGQRVDITQNISHGPNGWNGAGGASSSATDLLRFARALSDGTLLDPAWAELMAAGKYPITPAQHNPDQPPAQSYLVGYGIDDRIADGQRTYGHTGGMEVPVQGSSQPGGGSTALTIYPDLGVIAVVLSNYFLYPGIGTFLTEQDRIITQNAT